MSGADAIIEVEKLSKVYGAVPALQGLNFSIQRGESVLLLGANGSGKSTLLRLLSGLSKPTSGSIRIGGWEMPREAMAVRAQIGLVAHRPLLYESLTARENLAFCGALYGIEAGERRRRIETLLRQVGLARRADSLVRTFSRGMQQRLSIARVLLHQPALLLLDEPYTGLDQAAGELLDDLLISALNDGRTVLMSTHQLERSRDFAGRALILSRGTIRHDGPVSGDLSAIYRRSTAVPAP